MAYVIISARIQCPFCNQTSVEQLVAQTERFDREQMARALSRQPYDCQFCSQTLPDDTHVNARAELATADRLKQLGFPAPRTN
jgi:transposase-like protein